MLNNYAYIFVFILSISVLIYLYLLYYKKLFKKRCDPFEKRKQSKTVSTHVRKNPVLSIGNRQKLKVQNRMEYSEENSVSTLENTNKTEHFEKKIGVKKARKLEEKKLKKEQREFEEREKAVRKKLEEDHAEKERLVKERERKEIMELEAELEKDRKLKENLELELYEQLKVDFVIEDEGNEIKCDATEAEKLLDEEIINHLIKNKTVMIEELAGQFNLKTQVCAEKIKEYLKLDKITGVIDDRGKFIHVTKDEYNKVVKFILQRGRIHIKELVENSNKLIRLF